MPDELPSVRESLLDRLLDEDPKSEVEATPIPAEVLRRIRSAVARDLQDLLNTRWRLEDLPEEHVDLPTSLLNYGLPDFAKLRDPVKFDEMCAVIRKTIERYEPRLRNATVTPLTRVEHFNRKLEFRIDAMLRVDPLADEVTFSSVLEPSTSGFKIERKSN